MSAEIPSGAAEQTILLYAPRKKLYPRETKGFFNSWRWALVWATQLLYYGLPWLSWEGRPAVLFNLVERKFFIFGLVLWPQDFIYLTALLVASAFGLFLFTAVAGRLFCGYACPQTVYTEIFMKIEYWIEGNRAKKLRLAPAAHRRALDASNAQVFSLVSDCPLDRLYFCGLLYPHPRSGGLDRRGCAWAMAEFLDSVLFGVHAHAGGIYA